VASTVEAPEAAASARETVQVPADPCHVAPARSSRGSLVFLGEFVRAKDDDESGYAEALRMFYFKPLEAWRGVTSADEIGGALFLVNGSERAKAVPHFRPGQRVFVVLDLGGMSGNLRVVAEAISQSAARSRIAALGAPCWTR
jgi:hypothetical protein